MKKFNILLFIIVSFLISIQCDAAQVNQARTSRREARRAQRKLNRRAQVNKTGLNLNPTTYKYFTSPSSPDINQNEYHNLVWQCKDILKSHAQQHQAFLAQYPGAYRSGSYDPNNNAGKTAVREYLQRLATSTSIRLLKDLEKNNFVIS